MARNDPEDAWSLLAGLRCRGVRHLAGYGRAWESWGVHYHSVPSVVLGLAGITLLDVAEGRILPLAAGEAVLIDPWVWHIHRAPNPGGVGLLIGRIGAVADLEVWRSDGTWYGETPLAGLPIAGLAEPGDDCAAGDRLIAALAGRRPQPRHVPLPVQRMSSFIWRMRTQPVSAAEVLAASGLGYAAAHEAFVRRFGETPKQYLLRTRLELARHLLRGGVPLAEVWGQAGFTSRADLSRRFRLAYGLPPLAWLVRSTDGPSPGRA
ncbi:MAG: AraC family transcriptional regulator [Planctomycetes bacterium]|nr:AraC family transcriptional regulator [Planctomycetota bacterium]